LLPRKLPSRVLPEGWPAGQLKKVGSACASRFFLNSPFQRSGERSSLRNFATVAVVVTSENRSVSGAPLIGREIPSCLAFPSRAKRNLSILACG
jgi:hypothetical protein